MHPNILKFIDSKEFKDYEYWLITEYYQQGSLTDYIRKYQLSESDVGQISTGIITGLAFLHEDSTSKPVIAHRDFKSKNVLVKQTENGSLHAVIADFGLAKRFVKGQNPNDNQPQIGTRRYMAPELQTVPKLGWSFFVLVLFFHDFQCCFYSKARSASRLFHF